MQIPLILQQEATECGLACLAMILRKFGSNVSLEFLRKNFEISLRGTSIAELVRISSVLHLKATVYSSKPQQLEGPAILYWKSNHYVVLNKIDPYKGFHILDPASGSYWINREKFSKYYSGYAITFKLQDDYIPIKENYYLVLKNIFKDVPQLSSHMGFVIFSTFILHILVILFPCFIQKLIDPSFSGSDWITTLKCSIVILLSFKICEALIHLIRGMNIARWEKIFTEHIGLKILNHLLHLPLNFFEKRSQSSIYCQFSSIERTREILSRGLAEGLVDGLFSILILLIIFIYNIQIGFIVSLLTIGYLFFNYVIAEQAQVYNQIQIKERSKEVSFLLESLKAIIPIKIFGKEKYCINKWGDLHRQHLSTAAKIQFLQSVLDFFRILLFGVQITLVISLALMLIAKKELTLGVLYALLFYINSLSKNISSITSKWFDLKMIATHAQYLSNILFYQPELNGQKKSSAVQDVNVISLENISFRYHKNEPWILENINLSFQAGECIMLFGPSGYGKTTLLKIIMSILQPTSGQIYINNRPLEAYGIQVYRSKIAAVMQNDELFNGTLYQNISFFAGDINYKKVENCAKLAGIAEEIEAMPMGYNSYIGDMGIAISGGQKQRILLARALYSDPRILFLDEAFSNLDIERENSLNLTLRELGITQFIITHRLVSLHKADRVIDLCKINPPKISSPAIASKC